MTTIFDLKADKLFAYIFISFSFILPGVWILYIKNSDIFSTLDFYKLFLLAIFYSVPIFFIGNVTTDHVKNTYQKIIKLKKIKIFNIFLFLLLFH